MNIKPSAAIRQNYNEIASICKTTGEPVYLTKNGEGDLVVMDIDAFTRREKMLKLREELLTVEEERLHGEPGYTVGQPSRICRTTGRAACAPVGRGLSRGGCFSQKVSLSESCTAFRRVHYGEISEDALWKMVSFALSNQRGCRLHRI